jgi:hypothetical protein
MLGEVMQAINAAAEERRDTATEARRLWPILIDLILDAASENPGIFADRYWGDEALASVIPNPAYDWGYLTLELQGEPVRWRDLLAWSSQVDRWVRVAAGHSRSIDALVVAVDELELGEQIDTGLKWIESILGAGDDCARAFTLPEWLRRRRVDLTASEQRDRWQRVVDRLVVAGDSRVADLAD